MERLGAASDGKLRDTFYMVWCWHLRDMHQLSHFVHNTPKRDVWAERANDRNRVCWL